MKNKLILSLFAAASIASAQTNNEVFISGSLDIKYNSRTQSGKEGVSDNYKLEVNVANSAIFRGEINHLPYIKGTISDQKSTLNYAVDTFVVNPKNPTQTKNVGRLYGTVPIDPNNVYLFDQGNLKMGINSIGTAQGFESRFSGIAMGKPPAKPAGWFDTAKREIQNITRSVNGKTISLSVSKYDKMEFKQHVLASGPVAIYPNVTLNGVVLYDYARSTWFIKDVSASYVAENRQVVDRISGSIRWVESAQRKKDGKGFYEFDIKVNEPIQNESSAFAGAADESAFFEVDTSIPSLTGLMEYKDTLSPDGTVLMSSVVVKLNGNKLTKQQGMYLCKLFMLSSIVPLNAE